MYIVELRAKSIRLWAHIVYGKCVFVCISFTWSFAVQRMNRVIARNQSFSSPLLMECFNKFWYVGKTVSMDFFFLVRAKRLKDPLKLNFGQWTTNATRFYSTDSVVASIFIVQNHLLWILPFCHLVWNGFLFFVNDGGLTSLWNSTKCFCKLLNLKHSNWSFDIQQIGLFLLWLFEV